MKKIFAVLSLFVSAVLVGCSNDDPDPNNGENNGGNDVSYIAVNIVQPSSSGRSATSVSMESGSTAENIAQKAVFSIFDAEGNFYDAMKFIEVDLGASQSFNQPSNVEKIYNAVLVINASKENPAANARQLVCILNLPAADLYKAAAQGKITNLQTLMSTVGDYSEGAAVDTDGDGTADGKGFVMSNAAYKDGTNSVVCSQITLANLANDRDEAEKRAVNVYVERVVAKVRAKADPTFNDNNTVKVLIGDSEHTYSIRITGIEVANVANVSYLGKQLPATDPFTGWSDPTNHRSYWETMPTTADGLKYINQSYNTITGNSPRADGATEFSFDYLKSNYYSTYIQPNTPADSHNATSILVTAQLYDGDSPVKSFVYLRGFYFTEADAKNVIAGYIKANDYVKQVAEGTYESLAADDFVWTCRYTPAGASDAVRIDWLKDYEVVAQINPDKHLTGKIFKNTAEGKVEAYDELNTFLRGSATTEPRYKARVFTDGMCYYYANIEHFGTDAAGKNIRGIVRNHIYDLNITSIGGLGVAVFDPDQEIIPDKPSDEHYYLQAKINVLAWNLVKQNIEFK